MLELSFIWAGLIAFAVLAYVVLDGFDLGIGILFPTFERGRHRDQSMNSIAPVWDGNETWLVMGGGGLLGATWLIMKAEGELQAKARRYARRLGIATIAAIAVVSAVTPFLEIE